MSRYQFPLSAIDASLIATAAPASRPGERAAWAVAFQDACNQAGANTIRRVAAILAQCGHESADFTRLSENLNYTSPQRIMAVFGQRRFPSVMAAQPYVGQPEKLANLVYANRLGNGPPESGDGWRFRGGGAIQLTGRDNWSRFAAAVGRSIIDAAEWGRTIEGAAAAAAWFWSANGLNALADTPGVFDETRRINGGQHGIEDRKRRFDALVCEMLRREKAR